MGTLQSTDRQEPQPIEEVTQVLENQMKYHDQEEPLPLIEDNIQTDVKSSLDRLLSSLKENVTDWNEKSLEHKNSVRLAVEAYRYPSPK
jgi:hypothetical protein